MWDSQNYDFLSEKCMVQCQIEWGVRLVKEEGNLEVLIQVSINTWSKNALDSFLSVPFFLVSIVI